MCDHCTGYCIVQVKEEINRCEHLKRQTVEREVLKARTELTTLWDKCYISQEQRVAFSAFHDGNLYLIQFLFCIAENTGSLESSIRNTEVDK